MYPKKPCTFSVFLSLAQLAFTSGASAEVIRDFAQAEIDTVTNDVNGVSSGYNSGMWYEYPQPSPEPAWWSPWFFNGPDINGWKWIEYYVEVHQLFGYHEIPTIEVAINWSGPNWLDPSTPPIPGVVANPEDYIVRQTIFEGPVVEQNQYVSNVGDPLIIPDYNPLWVSIDLRTLEPGTPIVTPVVGILADIWHEHVPEPSSLALLVGAVTAGLLGCGLRRRTSRC
jgi:hypothetical protein